MRASSSSRAMARARISCSLRLLKARISTSFLAAASPHPLPLGGGEGGVRGLDSGALAEFPRDVTVQEADREQVGDGADPPVVRERAEVGVRHAGAQLVQALLGDLAVLDELGVALEDRLGEQLAARDLDAELALQPE